MNAHLCTQPTPLLFLLDDIYAGAGDDVVNTGAADRLDDVWLNGGSDTLVFEQGGGINRVRHFGDDDQIDLSSYGFASLGDVDYSTTPNGRHTTIDLGNGESIMLFGTTADELDASNFIL